MNALERIRDELAHSQPPWDAKVDPRRVCHVYAPDLALLVALADAVGRCPPERPLTESIDTAYEALIRKESP